MLYVHYNVFITCRHKVRKFQNILLHYIFFIIIKIVVETEVYNFKADENVYKYNTLFYRYICNMYIYIFLVT